ncbi:TIGR03757 family integrating conjugative element protein [Janthinobacterium sp. BJB446]|uniref:TIGR03757 family integrating conjugative element protein n=1 Tax=Janthinobacterium sp. BJB446 TaxID=2048009 RepID=UPI000C11188A|nr:TIGR03757 family integrating conjugative element protein [Janthinobacterium sp. BJB446]PHV19190.1 TIGR03757 family integrating conjugative element protein [Janthinobacterium sp. BJB446]
MMTNSLIAVFLLAAATNTVVVPGTRLTNTHPANVVIERPSIGINSSRPVTTVEVFSNSAIYLTNIRDARVYVLDAMEALDSELSAGLPGNELEAQSILRQRLHALGAAALARRTKSAAEGIVQAARYGVDRIPAVVINGEAVIYGETDIDLARSIFQHSSRQ